MIHSSTTPRLFGFIAVAGLHLMAYLLFRDAVTGVTVDRPTHESVITAFIQPRIREPDDARDTDDLAARLAMVRFTMPSIDIPQPEIDLSVGRNAAASSVAPTLIQIGEAGMAPYIKEAALLPGEGATVVLRIEVLPTGDPGEIAVDVSSGSRQIDQAAIDYARVRHWYAGRIGGSPHAMWIRWGVRLQA